MADLDAPFVEGILDVAQKKREANVEHRRQANDLRADFEVPKRGAFGYPNRLGDRAATRQPKFL